jgi:hypothetical protein
VSTAYQSVPNSAHFFDVDPETFRAVTIGVQHAFVAPDELGILAGDQVVLREWLAGSITPRGRYSGQWICRRVTSILPGGGDSGIVAGFGVLSFNNAAENEFATSHLRKEMQQAERRGVAPARFFEFKAAAEAEKRVARQKVLALARVRP